MPISSPSHLSPNARQLITLSYALRQSNCYLEDLWWDKQIASLLNKALGDSSNNNIETALEYLAETEPEAYEILFDAVEKATESIEIEHNGKLYDALLIAAPIMVWTRYQLPSGDLSSKQHLQLLKLFKDTVAAPGAQAVVVPQLLNFDSLPVSFHDTHKLVYELAQAILLKEETPQSSVLEADLENVLAETYFVVGAILVPKGKPLFRWQNAAIASMEHHLELKQKWIQECKKITENIFTGCSIEVISPKPYYASHRAADHKIRPFVLRAAIDWLQTVTNQPSSSLQATIIGCGDPSLEEYRIGFTSKSTKRVIYGCIWPVLTKDEVISELMSYDEPSLIEEIAAILKEEGIDEVRRLPNIVLGESCDDCGAPYFPNHLGELKHPKLPDETNLDPISLH